MTFNQIEPLALRFLPDDGLNDPQETLYIPGGIVDKYSARELRDWLSRAIAAQEKP